jgi:hypothetical protein
MANSRSWLPEPEKVPLQPKYVKRRTLVHSLVVETSSSNQEEKTMSVSLKNV